MPIISSPEQFNEDGLYIDLRSIFGHSLALKCEGFNFAGSVKMKAAVEMGRTWSSRRRATWAWR
jgi:cysteine synthase A